MPARYSGAGTLDAMKLTPTPSLGMSAWTPQIAVICVGGGGDAIVRNRNARLLKPTIEPSDVDIY